MAGYRGGICADLAHERGHMRLFSGLLGGRPGTTSGANRAKQQRISPADAQLRQTLKPSGRRIPLDRRRRRADRLGDHGGQYAGQGRAG